MNTATDARLGTALRLTPSSEPLPDVIPAATPAAADAICWIWAAIPPSPRTGSIHVARVAAALKVSDTTVRRWIKDAPTHQLRPDVLATLRMRANLRGHGDFLWPPLGERQEPALLRAQAAQRNARSVDEDQIPSTWATNGTLLPSTVALYYHAPARVFGLTSGSTPGTRYKLERSGAVMLQGVQVPSKWHAEVLKADVLQLVGPARCLPPRSMIPVGRTETWHRRAGDVDLHAVALTRWEPCRITREPV